MSDVQLCVALRAKDPEAFATAYNRYAEEIGAYVARRVEGAAVEDIVQEVFLRVLQDRDIRQLRGFIYRTASNLIVDWQRKRAKIRRHQKSVVFHATYEQNSQDIVDMHDLVSATRLTDLEHATIRSLYYEGLSIEAVAQKQGVKKGWCASALSAPWKNSDNWQSSDDEDHDYAFALVPETVSRLLSEWNYTSY
jgi:RNA polymerase sigma factor (sigma-70 family)